MDNFVNFIKFFLYSVVVFLIATFIFGKFFNSNYLLSFTDFQSNGGVWLMFLLLIFGVHLPELRVLVKEIIKEKIENYSGEMLYKDMKNRTINDPEYIANLVSKIDSPEPIQVIREAGEEDTF